MKYLKYLLIIGVLAIIASCSPIKNLYVPFSEAKQKHSIENDGVIRIYFDRMGFIYPDIEVCNKDFKKNNGKLNLYYSNHLPYYRQLCKQNNVNPLVANMDTVAPFEDPLQATLIKKYIDQINNNTDGKELVFIIHGYNEFPLDARDISSYEEMRATREALKLQFKNKEFQFVEIYWDGLSQEGGSKILRHSNSIRIWDNAQVSATHTGLELRRLFSGLNSNNFIVITHSHGAGVITTALFNVIKFYPKYYSIKNHWLYEVKMKYNNNLYDTPKQNITIGMLAPAIPGVNVFKEYFHRTEEGLDIVTTKKNYHFIVGFNENDPITSKFKIAAKKLGSTTLACKAQELLRTENLYNDRDIIDHVNFSKISNCELQKSHSWFSYLSNKPSIDNFFIEVFK